MDTQPDHMSIYIYIYYGRALGPEGKFLSFVLANFYLEISKFHNIIKSTYRVNKVELSSFITQNIDLVTRKIKRRNFYFHNSKFRVIKIGISSYKGRNFEL